jgi:hypothetical protein
VKWLRKLMGTDFPDPVVGQVWRCARNNEFMRVSNVHVHTSGTVFISCHTWNTGHSWGPEGWGMGDNYAMGLGEWRRRLREERRMLMGHEYDPRHFCEQVV